MYNEVRAICWVIGSPSECGNSSSRPSDVPCDRGDWAWLFGILLFYGPLWICVLLTIIAMGMIYMQVRNTFKRNDQYKFQGGRRLSNIISNRNGFASAAVLTESAEAAHQTIDAAGQMSSRMSRFSAFSSNKRALKELQEALEHEEDEAKINHFDDDAPLEDITENQDEDAAELGYPTERAPYYKNPISTDSEMSGGIGLKSGWMAAKNEVRMSQSTSVSLPTKRALKIQSRAQRKQNMFATQAILYSASFFITWTPSTVWSVAYWLGAGGIGYDLASATCEPLQGFWNMLIFIRSRPSSQEKLQRIFGSYCCRWLELLPKMYESSNEDSRVLDMSSVDRRGRISNARFSHESMEVMASEHPHFEIQPENEKSVHFDTEPSILDSL